MMNALLTLFSFVSLAFFPWPLTALLTILAAFTEPLVPLAVGIVADTLYYAPEVSRIPLFTLYGAIATLIALFVRTRVRTSSMQR